MTNVANEIFDKLLDLDFHHAAYKLGFIEEAPFNLNYSDVCKAIKALNALSTKKDEGSINLFIAISALLWEYSSDTFYGVKDILIILLSRIGYAPSSVVLEPTYKKAQKYQALNSYISQIETNINQQSYEVTVENRNYILTNFQYKIWQSLRQSRVVSISAPTSAGKSFVLLLDGVRNVIENKYNVIYVVPTLSLVNQVTGDFISTFKSLDYSNYQVLNSYNEELINPDSSQIFILTQEKAISAFSMSETPYKDNSILVIDEIQNIERVSSSSTEMRSKILLDMIFEFRFLDSIKKIIISGPRISEIGSLGSDLFGKKGNSSLSTDVSPVLNITYGIEQRKTKYFLKQYSTLNNKSKSLPLTRPGIIMGYGNKTYNQDFLNYLNEFTNNLGEDVQNIIFSPTSSQARKTALALTNPLFKPNPMIKDLSLYLKKTVHENYSLSETILSGAAYHHGKLPSHARKVIEVAMSDKMINNIASTTTLMQGINMPAQNIIIRNPHLYTRRNENSAELSSYEMANLRGRAGRLLKDFIGRTYVLDENEFSEHSDEYEEDNLFDNTYKKLDTSYESVFTEYSDEIETALGDEVPSNELPKEYRHIVIHIRQSILRHGSKAEKRLKDIGIELTKDDFEQAKMSMQKLSVSKDICIRNRYWDPLVLDLLFLDKNLPPVPTSVSQKGIKNKLSNILKYLRDDERYNGFLEDRIDKKYHNGRMRSILCTAAIGWAKEDTLKKILDKEYYEDPEHIEETIDLLQRIISFNLPILLRPIYEIQSKETIFLTFLESGAYKPITRRLIEIGIPRETAIYLSDEFFDDCIAEGSDDNISYDKIKSVISSQETKIPYWVKTQLSFLL